MKLGTYVLSFFGLGFQIQTWEFDSRSICLRRIQIWSPKCPIPSSRGEKPRFTTLRKLIKTRFFAISLTLYHAQTSESSSYTSFSRWIRIWGQKCKIPSSRGEKTRKTKLRKLIKNNMFLIFPDPGLYRKLREVKGFISSKFGPNPRNWDRVMTKNVKY